jgi:hypothetical protein
VLDSRTTQPSMELLPLLLEPIDPLLCVPMPDVPGLVLWPDCDPDMDPLLDVLGEVVLVLGVVVCELEVEL